MLLKKRPFRPETIRGCVRNVVCDRRHVTSNGPGPGEGDVSWIFHDLVNHQEEAHVSPPLQAGLVPVKKTIFFQVVKEFSLCYLLEQDGDCCGICSAVSAL
jgi:hypothetical protein